MSLHSDTLFWFRANQSLLLLHNDVWLAEKQQIQVLYSLVWPDRGSNPWYTALEANTLTITPPMWLYNINAQTFFKESRNLIGTAILGINKTLQTNKMNILMYL